MVQLAGEAGGQLRLQRCPGALQRGPGHFQQLDDSVAGHREPGAEALHTSLALAREARAAGADGVVIPPPVTTRPSRRELVRYFVEIAAAGELPAMVQDAPEFLGIELGVLVLFLVLGVLFEAGVWYKYSYDLRESAGGVAEFSKQVGQVKQVLPGVWPGV